MKRITIDQAISWKPCGIDGNDDGVNYTSARIKRLFAGREHLSARDVVALDIPASDKLWALLHREFLSDMQMHELACRFAARVVHLCDDERPSRAIEAKRAWLRGEIDGVELAAARAAADDAARAAAWAAARAAADDAAWDAARDAARAAAWAAADDAAWDAAWAARAAALDAAWAARAAALDAAWAARAAALDAAVEWQFKETLKMIDGE